MSSSRRITRQPVDDSPTRLQYRLHRATYYGHMHNNNYHNNNTNYFIPRYDSRGILINDHYNNSYVYSDNLQSPLYSTMSIPNAPNLGQTRSYFDFTSIHTNFSSPLSYYYRPPYPLMCISPITNMVRTPITHYHPNTMHYLYDNPTYASRYDSIAATAYQNAMPMIKRSLPYAGHSFHPMNEYNDIPLTTSFRFSSSPTIVEVKDDNILDQSYDSHTDASYDSNKDNDSIQDLKVEAKDDFPHQSYESHDNANYFSNEWIDTIRELNRVSDIYVSDSIIHHKSGQLPIGIPSSILESKVLLIDGRNVPLLSPETLFVVSPNDLIHAITDSQNLWIKLDLFGQNIHSLERIHVNSTNNNEVHVAPDLLEKFETLVQLPTQDNSYCITDLQTNPWIANHTVHPQSERQTITSGIAKSVNSTSPSRLCLETVQSLGNSSCGLQDVIFGSIDDHSKWIEELVKGREKKWRTEVITYLTFNWFLGSHLFQPTFEISVNHNHVVSSNQNTTNTSNQIANALGNTSSAIYPVQSFAGVFGRSTVDVDDDERKSCPNEAQQPDSSYVGICPEAILLRNPKKSNRNKDNPV